MDVVCGESVDGIHDDKDCVCGKEGFPVSDKDGRDIGGVGDTCACCGFPAEAGSLIFWLEFAEAETPLVGRGGLGR